jgi:hypothetical protein
LSVSRWEKWSVKAVPTRAASFQDRTVHADDFSAGAIGHIRPDEALLPGLIGHIRLDEADPPGRIGYIWPDEADLLGRIGYICLDEALLPGWIDHIGPDEADLPGENSLVRAADPSATARRRVI